MSGLFAPTDLAAIEAAVREAETRTTGEIYCIVAEESSDYGETPLVWAAGVALLGPALLLLLGGVHLELAQLFSGGWSADPASPAQAARIALIEAMLIQGVLFAVTFFLVRIPAVRLALTPGPFKRERVRERALTQFVAKNLQATRERTGVLIYVSLAEHMAELIADEGISAVVEPKVWDDAMAALVAGLKRGAPVQGFADAIRLCTEVLAERFPARLGDNPNELPDAVVVIPRT